MNKKGVIRLPFLCKRITFAFLIFLAGCLQKDRLTSKDISIVWKDERATGLSIPRNVIADVPEDSIHAQVQIRLANHGEQPAIPGHYIIKKTEVIFEPIIPFTRGLHYEILLKNQILLKLEVPKATVVPELLAIYPAGDTVPENLLKIYLVFSKPMVEGKSLQYIQLEDQKGDSLPQIFLGLQPELWNQERTILTLWLDPGRIKRDLQPNKLLGPPLVKGEQYKLIVSAGWPDEQGLTLNKTQTKNIVATVRDTSSPAVHDWKLTVPMEGTTQPFEVDFGEPLDHILLQNTIRLIDPKGNILDGSTFINDQGRKYQYRPAKPWVQGVYKLQIETRLEDLAGNNLNRRFEVDLQNKRELLPAKEVIERNWFIANPAH